MNIAHLTLTAAALASAAGVAAAAPASDVDYLKASRCRGIAVGLGLDASAVDSYLKSAARGRTSAVLERGDQEFAKAKRQAGTEAKTRLSTEFNAACTRYAS